MIYTRRKALLILGGAIPAAYVVSQRVRRRSIPFLITADVHHRPNCEDELNICLDNLARKGVKITFLVPAKICAQAGISKVFRRAVGEGHQVSCHGLTHDGDEDYYTNSFGVQLKNLSEAKHRLEGSLGCKVTAFRAPAFRISKHTLPILDSLGFLADLSICSQRLPLLSSQIKNYHLLIAPRSPYHPSADDPYVKGSLRLLEIPTSAAVLPLMSSVNGVSVGAMKLLTVLLHVEASVFTKPIVYQCHYEDFLHYKQQRQPFRFTWTSMIPNERFGIPLRWSLAETDGDILYRENQEFFSFLLKTAAFHFCTVDDYLKDWTRSQ